LAKEGGRALAKWRSSLSSSLAAAAAAERETRLVKRGGRAALFRLKGLGRGTAEAMMMVMIIVLVFLRV